MYKPSCKTTLQSPTELLPVLNLWNMCAHTVVICFLADAILVIKPSLGVVSLKTLLKISENNVSLSSESFNLK